jgi:hypothetical protein
LAAKAALGPVTFMGRIIYVAAISFVLILLLRDFGSPSRLFWPAFFSLLFVVIAVQAYSVYSNPLKQRARTSITKTLMFLAGSALWLVALSLAAKYLRGLAA